MAKTLIGIVKSIAMKNTVVVRVERAFPHKIYKKIIKKHKNYKAHNADHQIKPGDTVEIKQSRPISKDKQFIISKIINK